MKVKNNTVTIKMDNYDTVRVHNSGQISLKNMLVFYLCLATSFLGTIYLTTAFH